MKIENKEIMRCYYRSSNKHTVYLATMPLIPSEGKSIIFISYVSVAVMEILEIKDYVNIIYM